MSTSTVSVAMALNHGFRSTAATRRRAVVPSIPITRTPYPVPHRALHHHSGGPRGMSLPGFLLLRSVLLPFREQSGDQIRRRDPPAGGPGHRGVRQAGVRRLVPIRRRLAGLVVGGRLALAARGP